MKTIFTSLVMVLLLTAALQAQAPVPIPADLPEELITQVETDFNLPDCFEEGTPPLSQKVKTEIVALTKTADGTLLITGTGACLRGSNGNGPFLVYALFGKNWRAVLKADGEKLVPLSSMISGWHDVEVSYRNSPTEVARYVYRFSKNEYKSTSCELLVQPKGSAQTERKICPGWTAR